MKVVIAGAGAVGLGLASCLAGSASSLALISHSAVEAGQLARCGFRRTGIFGEVEVAPERFLVHHSVEALAGAEIDFLLVCTKSTASIGMARSLEAIWSEFASPPLVVLCQNGWGNAEHFARHLPRERLFNARVITGFRKTSPTHVEVTVHADAIRLGSLFTPVPPSLTQLAAAVAQGGIPCETTDEIEKDLWAKVLYNCLLNPLGAIMDLPYGALGRRRELRAIMAVLAEEIFAVLEQSEHRSHWRSADDYLEAFYRELLPPTAQHESSMLHDVRAHRPTEIDALCGAVVALGEDLGVATPVNEALTVLVRALHPADPG